MPAPPERGAPVRTLVLGGIRSGKSGWAESAIGAAASPVEPIRYIATGPARDAGPSWQRRVDEHRHRRPDTWRTVETGDVAGQLRADPATATLVDDLGGWLTGVLDRLGWDGTPVDADVEELLDAVGSFTAPLVLVSPEVGLTVVPATAAGARFADELGRVNQRLAARCDQVVLVLAGQPVWVKPAPTATAGR